MSVRKVYRGYVQERQLRWMAEEDGPIRCLIFNEFKMNGKYKELEVEIRECYNYDIIQGF